MAKEKGKGKPNPSPPAKPVEDWREVLKIPRHIHAGVLRFRGWTPETTTSRAEYERAVKAFLTKPAGG
ncbi:MAG: hypothetical protein L3J76_04580 [Candidatus Hydrothermae bacterium]|nr:hypothetical protein [Candidatus Hydrothermae bacterium]